MHVSKRIICDKMCGNTVKKYETWVENSQCLFYTFNVRTFALKNDLKLSQEYLTKDVSNCPLKSLCLGRASGI